MGTDAELTGYSILAELANPTVLPMGRHATATGTFTQWQPGVIALVDFDGGAFHRSRELTREHLQEVLRRVSGTEVTLKTLTLASTPTSQVCRSRPKSRAPESASRHLPSAEESLPDPKFGGRPAGFPSKSTEVRLDVHAGNWLGDWSLQALTITILYVLDQDVY